MFEPFTHTRTTGKLSPAWQRNKKERELFGFLCSSGSFFEYPLTPPCLCSLDVTSHVAMLHVLSPDGRATLALSSLQLVTVRGAREKSDTNQSDSGVRTLSDQSPPLLSSILIILIPGCRVCCVLIPIPAPSQRRVVPRVSEPFTGTITMSPGSRHQHQDHNINIRTSRAVIHPDSA